MIQVQVFIPVFNDELFLDAAIQSVLAQKDVGLEVVVMDNASTDNTLNIAESAALRDPRVIVQSHTENIGMLANFNRCIETATAPFFMMLCSDDLLLQTSTLETAVRIASADDSVASVYCDLVYVDSNGDKISERKFGRSGFFDPIETFRRSIRTNRNCFGIPLIHRTSHLKSVSYSAKFPYTGDLHVSLQVAQHGRIFHIPERLIGNRYTGANATGTLVRNARDELRLLAHSLGIRLSTTDRVLSNVTFFPTLFAKQLFLLYAERVSHRQSYQ